jgi:hypothetical protein
MKIILLTFLAMFFYQSSASVIPDTTKELSPRATSCENTATTRSCWGNYSLDTDWCTVVPETGVTRGKVFSARENI